MIRGGAYRRGVAIDLDQLMRGLELLGVTRADIESVRAAASLDDQVRALAELQTRTKRKAHDLARAWHPDLIGDVAAEQYEDDLRAVLVGAAHVAAMEPEPRRYGFGPRWRARARPVDMGVAVDAHWTD